MPVGDAATDQKIVPRKPAGSRTSRVSRPPFEDKLSEQECRDVAADVSGSAGAELLEPARGYGSPSRASAAWNGIAASFSLPPAARSGSRRSSSRSQATRTARLSSGPVGAAPKAR